MAVGGPGEIGSVLSRRGRAGGALPDEGVGGNPTSREFESGCAEVGFEYWY